MAILRKYLYIDEDFVNDAYSTIVGYDHDEQEIISSSENKGEGRIGFDRVVSAGIGGSKSSEKTVKINASKSIPAKLQAVIDYLKAENDEDLPYYEQIDDETFATIHRDFIFEGVFNLNFTKIEQYAQFINMTVLIDEIINSGNLKDPKILEGISALQDLAEQERENGITCVLKFVNDKKYPCYCKIDQSFIRTNYALLQGEVTVLCKVSRIIPKGSTVNLTNITELSKFNLPNLNTRQGKAQLVQNIKSGKQATIKDFQDEIRGPAFEIVPIAIYK